MAEGGNSHSAVPSALPDEIKDWKNKLKAREQELNDKRDEHVKERDSAKRRAEATEMRLKKALEALQGDLRSMTPTSQETADSSGTFCLTASGEAQSMGVNADPTQDGKEPFCYSPTGNEELPTTTAPSARKPPSTELDERMRVIATTLRELEQAKDQLNRLEERIKQIEREKRELTDLQLEETNRCNKIHVEVTQHIDRALLEADRAVFKSTVVTFSNEKIGEGEVETATINQVLNILKRRGFIDIGNYTFIIEMFQQMDLIALVNWIQGRQEKILEPYKNGRMNTERTLAPVAQESAGQDSTGDKDSKKGWCESLLTTYSQPIDDKVKKGQFTSANGDDDLNKEFQSLVESYLPTKGLSNDRFQVLAKYLTDTYNTFRAQQNQGGKPYGEQPRNAGAQMTDDEKDARIRELEEEIKRLRDDMD